MKTKLLMLALIILVACKKKETTPEPQPTTTGSTPVIVKDTIMVVLGSGLQYQKLMINWDYSANGPQIDSVYNYQFGPNTQTKLITSDSISVDYLCSSSSTATAGAATQITIYKNGTTLINYPAALGRKYVKIK